MAGDGVAIFDIDGGLADMSVVTDQLGPKPWRRPVWQEFFARLGEATVFEAGRDLVAATTALGFTVTYYTTRPDFTIPATRQWLARTAPVRAHNDEILMRPPGEYLTCTLPDGHPCRHQLAVSNLYD
jgi:hypothetical protein